MQDMWVGETPGVGNGYFSILAWKIKGTKKPLWATVNPWGSEESDMPEHTHRENRILKAMAYKVQNIYIDSEYQIGS